MFRNLMQSTFARQLESEILDGLAEDDPAAQKSRRDLARINRIMDSAGLIFSALDKYRLIPRRIIELGAGDGILMLRLAQKYSHIWGDVHLTLLDRQRLVTAKTQDAFHRLGWTTEILCVDVMDWVNCSATEHWDIGIANLFIHHFSEAQITALFNAIGTCTDFFIACEPRRARLPLCASRLVGLIGANEVTREDAVLSVRAGFFAHELSALWPHKACEWQLEEELAGLFSHRFVASRRLT
jgi:hypothetical protein